MGRRKKEAGKMGKALIKDRFAGKPVRNKESFLHTTEMNDGVGSTWETVNVKSVTEQTSLDDFLLTAEMAGRDFTAEKENVQVVTPQMNSGVLSAEKLKRVKAAQDAFKDLLRIPRRPPWNESTSAEKLRENEQNSFLQWRRQLAWLQEDDNIVVTPYEKNLEFWRQLWRVIERSDVVVQIVDARNPLLFYCPDLDKYVREIDPMKQTILLINKADLLTVNQRQAWAEHFTAQGVSVVFWSAVEETARLEREKNAESDSKTEDADEEEASTDHVNPALSDSTHLNRRHDDGADDSDENNEGKSECDNAEEAKVEDSNSDKKCDNSETAEREVREDNTAGKPDDDAVEESEVVDDDSDEYETEEEFTDDEADLDLSDVPGVTKSVVHEHSGKDNSSNTKTAAVGKDDGKSAAKFEGVSSSLQNSDELLALFRKIAKIHYTSDVTTVGLVGYPNVGKSSTINAILQTKKVPVSATPGRTKHFQTLYVEKDLMLCDCPGLVFPSFVNSKAELVVNGILPIDQLQDSEPPVELLCHRIGRATLEGTYHINLPPPEKWEDPEKPPSAYDLMHVYALLRGFMSQKGNTDNPRAARYLLKDYVNGKLLFCQPPPGIEAAAFQKPPYGGPRVYRPISKVSTKKTVTEIKSEVLDKEFFAQMKGRAHVQGPHARHAGPGQDQSSTSGTSTPLGSMTSVAGKPWKKHNNRNKKEKLRRVYADLDYD